MKRRRNSKRIKHRGYGDETLGVSDPVLATDINKVKKAVGKFDTKLAKVKSGEPVRETESVDHAQRMANAILVQTMNEIGLDARTVAGKLKTAMDLSMNTGKLIKDPMDPEGKRMIPVPDLRALKELLTLWGVWMKVGRTGGIQQQNNFFGAGLDEADRRAVTGIVERIEAEVKRRRLTDVHEGTAEPQDAEALPRMGESGEDE